MGAVHNAGAIPTVSQHCFKARDFAPHGARGTPYKVEAETPTAERVNAGRNYLEHQRSHMTFEEEKAFPLISTNLKATYFEYASGALPSDEEPLVDPLPREEYPRLVAALGERSSLPPAPKRVSG